MQPSDRLQKVLEIGDTLALFPVLRDWPTEELQALLGDVEEFTSFTYETIDKAWEKTAFKPAVFLSRGWSEEADRLRDQQKLSVMAMASEICSVAIFYLYERGVEVDEA